MCQDVAFIGAKDVVICHQNVRCEMKFRVQQISQGEDELILRYRQMNSEVRKSSHLWSVGKENWQAK